MRGGIGAAAAAAGTFLAGCAAPIGRLTGTAAGVPLAHEHHTGDVPAAGAHAGHETALGDVADRLRRLAGFDPAAYLVRFDSGTVSRLPDGRTLREWDVVAYNKELEVAPG